MGIASQKSVKQFLAQQVTKLKYNSKAAAKAIENLKDIFIQGYYKTKELKYILKADTEITTESKSVVGIKTPLNIVFIIL